MPEPITNVSAPHAASEATFSIFIPPSTSNLMRCKLFLEKTSIFSLMIFIFSSETGINS